MSFSWNTIEMESPLIRGRPEQFEEASGVFKTIADRTDPLSDELWDLRRGRSEGFAGEAAEAIGQRIGDILVPLSDVPKVSSEIDAVFDQHTRQLEVLVEKANQAVARAHTRWNRKESAEADVSRYERSVSYLSRQISQLRCWCSGICACGVPAQVASLESRRWNAQQDLSHARGDLRTAEGLVEDSRSDWTHLRREEDELNESTGHRLKTVPLWSLRDTGNIFTEKAEEFREWIRETWDFFINEFLEELHSALDTILDWVDAAGLILEWIPVVNVAYKAVEALLVGVKTLAGLGLALSGQMTWGEFALDLAVDAAGFAIPGGRLLSKGIKRVTKNGSLHKVVDYLPKRAKHLEDSVKKLGSRGAKHIYRHSPVIKQFNDLLYRASWKRPFREGSMRWKSSKWLLGQRGPKWLFGGPRGSWNFAPKPGGHWLFQDLDRRSWITRISRSEGFVKKGILVPFGKTYEDWASKRISEWSYDLAIEAGEDLFKGQEILREEKMILKTILTPWTTLTPCRF